MDDICISYKIERQLIMFVYSLPREDTRRLSFLESKECNDS